MPLKGDKIQEERTRRMKIIPRDQNQSPTYLKTISKPTPPSLQKLPTYPLPLMRHFPLAMKKINQILFSMNYLLNLFPMNYTSYNKF